MQISKQELIIREIFKPLFLVYIYNHHNKQTIWLKTNLLIHFWILIKTFMLILVKVKTLFTKPTVKTFLSFTCTIKIFKLDLIFLILLASVYIRRKNYCWNAIDNSWSCSLFKWCRNIKLNVSLIKLFKLLHHLHQNDISFLI